MLKDIPSHRVNQRLIKKSGSKIYLSCIRWGNEIHEFTKQSLSSALSVLQMHECLIACRAQLPEGLQYFECPSVLTAFWVTRCLQSAQRVQ